MRHHNLHIPGFDQREKTFILGPQLRGHLLESGRILRELAEDRAVHVISEPYFHNVGDTARNRRNVGLLR